MQESSVCSEYLKVSRWRPRSAMGIYRLGDQCGCKVVLLYTCYSLKTKHLTEHPLLNHGELSRVYNLQPLLYLAMF